MATRSVSMLVTAQGFLQAVWEGITESDDGQPIVAVRWPDKTVQVIGDFTSNGAITMEGSPDGTTWGTLHDPQGVDLVITDSEPRLIAENPIYIRPNASAGTDVDMDVYITGAM